MALTAMRTTLLVLLLAAAPARGEDRPWWSLVPDTYDGEIFSGTAPAKGATEFRAMQDGTLAGSYAFVEPDGTQIDGRLDACHPVPARIPTLACRWSDSYGAGDALFSFEDGLQGFRGFWFSPKIRKQGMQWTGRRRLGS